MKKKFSTAWKASKQPRKQRKYIANAPLHLRKKFVSVNLAKDLREKQGKRNLPLKKGDKVKVMRGKFKNKQGNILEVKLKTGKIYVEGIQTKKNDGSKVNVSMRASNLQIIEMIERTKKVKNKVEKTKTPKGVPRDFPNTLKGTSKMPTEGKKSAEVKK